MKKKMTSFDIPFSEEKDENDAVFSIIKQRKENCFSIFYGSSSLEQNIVIKSTLI